MNRKDFQELTEMRVREAKVLLDNNCFEGAYYLLGYSVECAFKACIAKQTKRFDFPDKNFASKVHTHDLTNLLKYSGLKLAHEQEIRKNSAFELNWAIVKDWNEGRRYIMGIGEREVKDFQTATLAKTNGVLSWLRKRW